VVGDKVKRYYNKLAKKVVGTCKEYYNNPFNIIEKICRKYNSEHDNSIPEDDVYNMFMRYYNEDTISEIFIQ